MQVLKNILLKIKDFILKFKWELIIIAAAVAIDQISKAIIYNTMELHDSVTLIPKFLNIYYTVNSGAAFSFLEGQTWFFIVVPFIAIIGFSIFLFHKKNDSKLFFISMSMIIGGALGNFLDRIFNGGYVHDFIEFEYFGLTIFGSKTFAIFNLADSFLTIGVVIFAVYFIFFYKDPKREFKQAADASNNAKVTDGNNAAVEEKTVEPAAAVNPEAIERNDSGVKNENEKENSQDD